MCIIAHKIFGTVEVTDNYPYPANRAYREMRFADHEKILQQEHCNTLYWQHSFVLDSAHF